MLADRLVAAQEEKRRQQLADLVVPMKAGVRLERVNPGLVAAAKRMINDNPYGGQITSGFRSIEEQARLYNSGTNPYPVAAPGKSKHNFGKAMDISGSPQAMEWFAANASKYGLHQPHTNDPVHFELIKGNSGVPAYSSVGQNFFNAIIRAEGTASGGRDPYNTSLGFMQSPKPLTSMTMNEVLAWGEKVRAAQGQNSSAKGAFQIVNQTQRNAMAALGIGGDEIFSPENQRKMAIWIAKTQGLGAWEGLKKHGNEMAIARNAFGAVTPEDIAKAGWNGQITDAGGIGSSGLTFPKADKAETFADGLQLGNIWDNTLESFMKQDPAEAQLQKQYENLLNQVTQTPKFTQSFDGADYG